MPIPMDANKMTSAAFILLAIAFEAAAAAPSVRAPSCAAALDSMDVLEAEGRIDHLVWDLGSRECSRSELYRGQLRQGIAFALAGSFEAAAAALGEAKAIGGPDDEELLYHLWTASRRLDRRAEAAAAAREMYTRFPASPYLAMILEDYGRSPGKARAGKRAWKAAFESRYARSRVGLLDNVQSSRLKGEVGQSAGGHGFREYGSLSLKSRYGQGLLDAVQGDFGVEWSWRGFGAEAEWALGWDARNTGDTLVAALAGSGAGARWSGWNASMAGAALSWMSAPGEGPMITLRADARLLSSAWKTAGASLSPSWHAGDFSLTGLLGVQQHWMGWAFSESSTLDDGEVVDLTYSLEGMRTVQSSLTPAWRLGNHDLSLGLAWFSARTAHAFRVGLAGTVDEEKGSSWEHGVALSPAWRFTYRKRLRFDFGFSAGYDFDEKTSATAACGEALPGYCADESYGADAGFSLTF